MDVEKTVRVKWTDRIRNKIVFEKVSEERMMLKLIRKRKRNWLGLWLKRIIDDIRILDHMRRLRGRQQIGKIGDCWVCNERPAHGQNIYKKRLSYDSSNNKKEEERENARSVRPTFRAVELTQKKKKKHFQQCHHVVKNSAISTYLSGSKKSFLERSIVIKIIHFIHVFTLRSHALFKAHKSTSRIAPLFSGTATHSTKNSCDLRFRPAGGPGSSGPNDKHTRDGSFVTLRESPSIENIAYLALWQLSAKVIQVVGPFDAGPRSQKLVSFNL
ncbi:hypothetical protein ANN_26348 [Periplaneta americana]|uniref:Uncharacterized protein n=1 Tax=Periplaneta americana TaxID=6978 RepID=A0ABQ8S5N0_PERAM|nr:hypothetical protein ANN_26348 [Periplaneta americana]